MASSATAGDIRTLSKQQEEEITAILSQSQIKSVKASDFAGLLPYKIVVVADDSSGMSYESAPEEFRDPATKRTHYDEMNVDLDLMVRLVAALDPNNRQGLDILYMNAGLVKSVLSTQDPRFVARKSSMPVGLRSATQAVTELMNMPSYRRPVIIVMYLSGEPDGGPEVFKMKMSFLVHLAHHQDFQVHLMVSGSTDFNVAWLRPFEGEFEKVGISWDYFVQRHQLGKLGSAFTRGDHCVKALLWFTARFAEARKEVKIAADSRSGKFNNQTHGGGDPDAEKCCCVLSSWNGMLHKGKWSRRYCRLISGLLYHSRQCLL